MVHIRPKEKDVGDKIENHLLMRSGCIMYVDGDEQELPSQQTRKESPRAIMIPTHFGSSSDPEGIPPTPESGIIRSCYVCFFFFFKKKKKKQDCR